MGKATLEEQVNMPDVVGTADFRLTFAEVPGSLGIDLEKVSLNCTQAIIPGITINKVEQRFSGGHKLNYGMSSTYSGTMAIQFIERTDAQTIIWMKKWQEFIRGTKTANAQGYKKDYSVLAKLEVYDLTGAVAIEISIYGAFIQEIPETNFDVTSDAQDWLLASTFSYDFWEVSGPVPVPNT